LRAPISISTFHTTDTQSDFHLLCQRTFFLTTTDLFTSVFLLTHSNLLLQISPPKYSRLHYQQASRLPRARLLNNTAVMFKLPLQTVRRSVRQPVSFSKRSLRSSATTDRTMCVSQAVNELQTAQTTTTGRIVNKICTRLANDRATTRTEQLIWLAKHALETSKAPKTSKIQEDLLAFEEPPKSCDTMTTSATSESAGRQS
jgi:hypothetical protein